MDRGGYHEVQQTLSARRKLLTIYRDISMSRAVTSV